MAIMVNPDLCKFIYVSVRFDIVSVVIWTLIVVF